MRNKIWMIEWIISENSFRVSRYAEPDKYVGYGYYIKDTIRDLTSIYPEWEVILIRDQAGCVSYKLNDENPEIVTFVDNLRRLLS